MVAVLEPESPRVFTLQTYEIDLNWKWIEPLLDKVEDRGWTNEDIRNSLKEGKSQFWGTRKGRVPTALWITRIENLGENTFGLVWIVSGSDLETIVSFYREFTEPWLKDRGCKWVEIVGRKGWAKVLPDFRERSRVLVKELV